MLSSVDVDLDLHVTSHFPTTDPDVQSTEFAVNIELPSVVVPSEPEAKRTLEPDCHNAGKITEADGANPPGINKLSVPFTQNPQNSYINLCNHLIALVVVTEAFTWCALTNFDVS